MVKYENSAAKWCKQCDEEWKIWRCDASHEVKDSDIVMDSDVDSEVEGKRFLWIIIKVV